MIPRLPHWVLTDRNPAFYDSESKTCIEMVAKIYAKMQELVDHYNEFVDPLNKEIEEHYKQLNEEYECFKNEMIKICHNYFLTIDEKIKMQEYMIRKYYDSISSKLDEAITYMKDNIRETTTEIANSLLQQGEIHLSHTYYSVDKKLNIVFSDGGVLYNKENKQLSLSI